MELKLFSLAPCTHICAMTILTQQAFELSCYSSFRPLLLVPARPRRGSSSPPPPCHPPLPLPAPPRLCNPHRSRGLRSLPCRRRSQHRCQPRPRCRRRLLAVGGRSGVAAVLLLARRSSSRSTYDYSVAYSFRACSVSDDELMSMCLLRF